MQVIEKAQTESHADIMRDHLRLKRQLKETSISIETSLDSLQNSVRILESVIEYQSKQQQKQLKQLFAIETELESLSDEEAQP